MKNILLLTTAFCLILSSCSTDSESMDSELLNAQEATNLVNESNAFTKFKVTIENLGSDEVTYPTVFSPGVYVVQKQKSEPLFMEGYPDYGDGLEHIAEDGNPQMLYNSLMNNSKVRESGAFSIPVGGEMPSPILPGHSYEFYITAKNKDHFTLATMFAQSNDIFIAPNSWGIPLFDGNKEPINGDVTMYLQLWDAGTEVNEEPGVGPNQAPRQSAPNTGIDENGVVHLVDDGYTYPNVSDMIKVTVTPQ